MARPRTVAADYRKLMVRLPENVLQACKARAAAQHRSLNAQILHELASYGDPVTRPEAPTPRSAAHNTNQERPSRPRQCADHF